MKRRTFIGSLLGGLGLGMGGRHAAAAVNEAGRVVIQESPLAGKPCGLVGAAGYSNPHGMLEYLRDFCTVLKMRPVRLDRFPYLGVAAQRRARKMIAGGSSRGYHVGTHQITGRARCR